MVSVKPSSGTPLFSVAINPGTDLWLSASPESGSLPASVSVRVNPTSLPVGSYTATVAVTVTGIVNPVNISVTLNVTHPIHSTLSATVLTFAARPCL